MSELVEVVVPGAWWDYVQPLGQLLAVVRDGMLCPLGWIESAEQDDAPYGLVRVQVRDV